MKCQLLPEDYARFVKCWNEVEVGMDMDSADRISFKTG